MNKERKLYFDVRTYSPENLTLVLAENRLAALEKRISPYPLLFDKDGRSFKIADDDKKPDEKGNLVPLEINENDEVARAEVLGMRRIWELGKRGYDTVAWFSPRGGNSAYVDGNRMALATKRDEIGQNGWLSSYWDGDENLKDKILINLDNFMLTGGTVFEARGICSQDSREIFFGKVTGILNDKRNMTLDPIKAPDDLRANPVGLNLNGQKWFDYLESHFPDMGTVWETIAEGEDLRLKLANRAIAHEITRLFGARINQVVSYGEAVKLGADIERHLQRKYKIFLTSGGNHGFSNEAAMGGTFGGLFNQISITNGISEGGSDKLTFCDVHRKFYLKKRGSCPLCSGKGN